MINSLMSIQYHSKYLLSKADRIKRVTNIKKWEFCTYFMAILQVLEKIVKLPTSSKGKNDLFHLLIPSEYQENATNQGVLNSFFDLEINFWSVIRYSIGFQREKGRIPSIKSFIVDLATDILNELLQKDIKIIKTDIVEAIKDWNTSHPQLKEFFQFNINTFDFKKDFHQIQFRITREYWEVDRFLQLIRELNWIFYYNEINLEESIIERLIFTEVLNMIRTCDQEFLFQSTPRYKEYFGFFNLNKLMYYIKEPSVKSVLDLFTNTGCIGILSYLYGKSYILLNDMSYYQGYSLVNLFMQKVQDLLFSNNKFHEEDRYLPSNRKILYKNLRKKLEKDKYTSNLPYLPITSSKVSLNNLWGITGPPCSINKDYEQRIVNTNIEVNQKTKPHDISNNIFDLIILDPPFGVASRYQIQEKEAVNLLTTSIKLSEHLIEKNGLIIVRKKRDWAIPNVPVNWRQEDCFGRSSNFIVFRNLGGIIL